MHRSLRRGLTGRNQKLMLTLRGSGPDDPVARKRVECQTQRTTPQPALCAKAMDDIPWGNGFPMFGRPGTMPEGDWEEVMVPDVYTDRECCLTFET